VPVPSLSPQVVAYLVAFGTATVACLAVLPRVDSIEDADTRQGLRWLLVTSAGWAAAHVGYLVYPSVAIATGFHVVGLIFGIGTIGPWLYFCSAYTGRRLHRDPRVRALAIAVFLGIVALKVTNPIHGLYFSVTSAQEPFSHLAVQYGRLHWIVTALAYVLAGIGYFMLFELFLKAGQGTRTLTATVSLTALPVGLNVLADTTDLLVDIGYEPLGVAAFAVGVLYVIAERFEVVRLTADLEAPAIYLDAEGCVRDYNEAAGSLLPALEARQGEPLAEAVPAVAGRLEGDEPIIRLDDGGRHYYRMTTDRFTVGRSEAGTVVVLSDVTETERHRRELERQNERLERFAGVVSHDLRNPLNVATLRMQLARETGDDEHLESAWSALERMDELIDDVLTLARQGQSIGETSAVSLAGLVEDCRAVVDLGDATLDLEGDLRFEADPERVQQLLENLLRNAIDHSDGPVAIRVGATADRDGFYVADDGPGFPPDERGDIFESGYTTAAEGTGFGLAIVSEIVDAHGWTIDVGQSDAGGARFEITGLERPWSDG